MLNPDHKKAKRPDTADSHARAVQRVISTFRDRLDEDISLEEMASVAYMSRYHFNRTFRQVTGLPPCRFLTKLRVEAATQMLLNTDSSVTDICLEVGYTSLGTFVRRFSDLLGISPMRLRAMRHSLSRDFLGQLAGGVAGETDPAPCVRGRVQAPASFNGPIFTGLFRSPIPEGTPVACTITLQPGAFAISSVSPGSYYVFALGLPWPDNVDDLFRYESALRGGGERVDVGAGMVSCEDISLRSAALTDPPVLLNLPILLDRNHAVHSAA